MRSVVTRPPEPAPTRKSPEEYVRRKLKRYWDDVMEYGTQLDGLDRNPLSVVKDFIRKNFTGYNLEELAPRLVYLCHGMERDELEVGYMIP